MTDAMNAPKNPVAPPLVSVVVPTFNQARYLEACLDSIWFQEWDNLEIVVVDDASTDETPEVLRAWRANVETAQASFASRFDEVAGTVERTFHRRYPQAGRSLVCMRNERNLGSTATYNRGFRAASGAYCTYVASDDLCHPGMLATLAGPLTRDEADFVYSDMFIIDDLGRIERRFSLPAYDFRESFAPWYLCGVSKLYRRELHERLGYFDESFLANDHECYLRFAMNGVRFLHVPHALYSVRSHDGREVGVHSSANWNRLIEESKRLTLKAREHLARQARAESGA